MCSFGYVSQEQGHTQCLLPAIQTWVSAHQLSHTLASSVDTMRSVSPSQQRSINPHRGRILTVCSFCCLVSVICPRVSPSLLNRLRLNPLGIVLEAAMISRVKGSEELPARRLELRRRVWSHWWLIGLRRASTLLPSGSCSSWDMVRRCRVRCGSRWSAGQNATQ